MEVLMLATNDSAMLRLDAVLRALLSSPEPVEILDGIPEHTQQLLDNQLIITRKLMTAVTLAAVIHNPPAVIPQSHQGNSSGSLPLSSSPQAAANPEVDTAHFLKKISKREKKVKLLTIEMEALRQNLQQAAQRVKHLEMEQEQFFEDVQDLESQYERLSQHHQKILWEYLPARDADMAAIPALSKQIQESETCIGKYPLQNVLGYGQYATVYVSSTPEEPNLAIKAIDKDKLIDLVALVRVNSEILSLSDPALQHPGILAVKDVIHTHKYIYLITERGGKDLFDHFGVRQEGLGEDTIKPLMQKVAQAVQVLHRHNYCHRDLKPENILYNPDSEPDHLVKLIDFGLCTKAMSSQDRMLYDFCGSSGFFAPEILLHECYDGMKADVWSLGCILLELVIGNTMFVTLWMNMYELDILKDRNRFAEFVKAGVALTREHCHSSKWVHSTKLRHLLMGMLCEKPQERFSIHQMLDHPWFRSDANPAVALSPNGHVLVRQVSQLDSLDPSSPPPSHRPPTKIKSYSTSSAPAFSSSNSHPLRVHALARSSSADLDSAAAAAHQFGALAVTATTSTTVHSPFAPGSSGGSLLSPRTKTVKVCLPSLSPEKPAGSCSPEKTFAKRSASSALPHHESE